MDLTSEQHQELKRVLMEAQAALQQRMSNTAQDTRPVSLDQPIGRLSRMDAIQQQAVAAESRRRLEIQLQRVNSALARMGAGKYGYCIRCEEPIAFARLQHSPEAILCMGCQSSSEK